MPDLEDNIKDWIKIARKKAIAGQRGALLILYCIIFIRAPGIHVDSQKEVLRIVK